MKTSKGIKSLNAMTPVPGMRNHLGSHAKNKFGVDRDSVLELRKKNILVTEEVNQKLGAVDLEGRTGRLKVHQKMAKEIQQQLTGQVHWMQCSFLAMEPAGSGLLWAWLLLPLHPENFRLLLPLMSSLGLSHILMSPNTS